MNQEPPINHEPQGVQIPTRQVAVQLPSGRPLVTYTLLGLTVFVFALQMAGSSFYGLDLAAALGAKVNEAIAVGQVWRLITPMFLHSTSMLLHIVFNMYALFSFGPTLERYYGHGRFLTLYLLAGFTGNVLSFVFSPAPSLGASTAIFGLLGAEAVFLYQNRRLLGRSAQTALINLVVIAALNLLLGFSSGFVDNWGHIGGLVGGVLFAWLGGPLLAVGGEYPNLQVVDKRSRRESVVAAAALFVAFGFLAAATIFMRS